MMRRRLASIGAGSVVFLAASIGATAFVAEVFDHQAPLGAPLVDIAGLRLYAPHKLISWSAHWSEAYPGPFAIAHLITLIGFVLACLIAALIGRERFSMKPFAEGAWGDFNDAKASGLFAQSGVVIGKLNGEILCFDGPEHQLLIGASRSGKGRGHVVPTLLAWPHSALVLDIKGELADGDQRHDFPGTARFRQCLGPVLRFAPTKASSHCFNPLLEVRRGPNEVRDVQNIVEILIDPAGEARRQDFWDRSAKQVLVGVILHVLYAEPVERKTLAVVREKLRDLDATAAAMKEVLHRISPITGAPETHPEVLHAAESYLAGEERMQSGVKATAESFFGLFADDIVAAKTARSDFRIGDLMCAPRPVTLFLQPPPSDALRLAPLLRLIINQIARTLMEDQVRDGAGRPKLRPMLMLLDEFPLLGRMPFFETMMGAMAGYGLKAFLVCQSLHHLTKAYGRENVILDNCLIVTAFAASDDVTSERLSKMAGDVWEMRESHSEQRPRPLLGWGKGSIITREERRPLISAAEVRSLPADQQLVFVQGTKPLRTSKLKFDREPIFRQRLSAAEKTAPALCALSTAHDWQSSSGLQTPVKDQERARVRPMLARTGLSPQADLFDSAAVKAGRNSQAHLGGAVEAKPKSEIPIAPAAPSVAPKMKPRPRRSKRI